HARRPDGSDYPREACPHLGVLRTARAIEVNDHFLRSDGTSFPVSCRTAPILREGDVIGLAYAFHDISAHVEAERERDRAAARVNQILESIGEAFLAVDRDWRVTYLNHHAKLVTRALGGAGGEEAVGRELWDLFPTIVGTRFEEAYRRAMRDRVAAHVEGELPPFDAWFEISVYPWAEGLSFFFRDITERRRAQQALQRSEARYRALVGATAQVVWTTDANGQLLLGWEDWARVTGQTRDQMERAGWLDAVHPDDRARVETTWRRALDAQQPYEHEFRLRVRDGSYRHYRGRGVPVVDGEGVLLEWVGTASDITERKRAEEERARILEREREAREVAQRAERRAALLARASAVLAESLDHEQALKELARIAVPELADWCSIHLRGSDGRIRRLVAAHADPSKEEVMRAIDARYAPDPNAPAGSARVIATGRAEYHPRVDDALLARVAQDEQHLELLRRADIRSALMVPIGARGRTFGSLALACAREDPYTPEDVAMAEDLGRRAGLAVDNARLRQSLRQGGDARDAAEARYAALVNSIRGHAVYALDLDGIITSWNPGVLRTKGYTKDEFIGLPFETLFTPEDRESGRPQHELAEALRSGHFTGRGWRQRKDGTRFWAEVELDLVRDEEGRPVGFVKVMRDVTDEHARLEEAQRERLLVESVAEYAIYMLDPEGRIVTWNAGARRLEGYTRDEILGNHYSIFFPPEAIERDVPMRNLLRAREQGVHEEEGWRVRKDGSRYLAHVTLRAVRDAEGRLMGFAKVTRDITDRQTEERRLSERARRQAAVADLGILALQGESLTRLFEEAVERLRDVLSVDYTKVLELEPDGRSLVLRAGRGWHAHVVPGESRVSAGSDSQAGHTLEVGTPVVVEDMRAEQRFRGPSLLVEHGVVSGMSAIIHGRSMPWGVLGVHVRSHRMFDEDDVDFLQSVANVLAQGIQRRQVEEELERRVQDRTAKLEQAVRDLETFANTASHDLRAPLRGTAELARILREEYASGMDATGRELVDRIARENQKATRLVHDLLAYARSTRKEIRWELVDVSAMAQEVLDEVVERHPERRVEARIQPGLAARADPTLLRIALNNLLSNATKYSSGQPEPVIELFATEEDGETAYHVRDNGVGFSEEEAGRLFRPFSRLSTA
ncbi:MAG TPA: PAS domain S-box protein, partial [Candidatus Thermoplasmatota archaeon]|nr:PAS domain S-box protein [Candidatus Thermoplasmatota archaeon]